MTQAHPAQIGTPQLQSQGLPRPANTTPTQTSPPKATPTKTVVKALPTVRDHTTDQLNAEGDEYVPREHDEQGERKVSPTGHPLEGRVYKCRTFFVPNRGEKLFMLATECARVLGYRDSYLLFNKNRSLYKIIATQPEKDDLIQQDILPYSYRSRQIAIVTAKSMFRQFGSRVIANGRRVRDDYWEAKARKQGFTEEDMAGEKRPGAAKARDAAAAEAGNASATGLGHPDIIYSNVPLEGQPQGLQSGLGGSLPATLAPQLPMIHLAPSSDDIRRQDYGNIPRPRQEIIGAPYQDRTQASSATEVLHQASNAAEYNKKINTQRIPRGQILSDTWNRKPAAAISSPQQQTLETSPVVSQSIQSPHLASGGIVSTGQQPMLQHQPSQMMSPQAYSHSQHGNSLSQSPVRGVPQQIRAEQMHQRSSGLSYAPGGAGQGSPYSYPQPNHTWGQPPPQPQQSPLAAHQSMSQYNPSSQQPPSHSSHSPHQPPQLHHSGSSGSLHSGMTFQGVPGGLPAGGYSGMGGRSMYQQQPSQSPQQYMQQTTAAQQAGMQGWAPPPQQGGQTQPPGQQGWPGY